jgi:ferritin-like metal-binding protein YciE
MAEPNAGQAKLIQYLNEAYAKEKELEVSLQAHLGMTPASARKPYRKRLQEHLKQTRRHAKDVERRIKKLGGGEGLLGTLSSGAGKVAAAAKGQLATAEGALHALRGVGEEERLLKNAKTEYWNEHEEIATYMAIETLAEELGDAETAKLARGIRREEERMARYLERLIPTLTKAMARAEIPASQRHGGRTRRRTGSRRRGGSRARSAGAARSGAGAGSR